MLSRLPVDPLGWKTEWVREINQHYQSLTRWLVLNGALCKDDGSGKLDVDTIKRDLFFVPVLLLQSARSFYRTWRIEETKLLLKWATNLHQARTSFLLFLSGALSAPKHANSTHRTRSHLQKFSGEAGVRELIGDYVGFVRGREARIVRQLTEMLPNLIQQLDGE